VKQKIFLLRLTAVEDLKTAIMDYCNDFTTVNMGDVENNMRQI
jgi:hypothetical protein